MTEAQIRKMRKKASQSICVYRIVAVAFSRKGNVIATITNKPQKNITSTIGHAEYRLMARYGRKIYKIRIARFGRSGEIRPISPCKGCLDLAKRLGITIESLME